MTDCEEFAETVGEYLDGRLPYGERVGMWLHRVMCPPCRHYAEQLRQLRELMNRLGEQWREDTSECPPAELKRDLLDRFHQRFDDEQ